MPHVSIVTKILTTQRLTRESVLRLFDILGSIHSKPENNGFHKQDFDYFRPGLNVAFYMRRIELLS